jgi:DNA invertase Pin-like site-specific DNA recombinase
MTRTRQAGIYCRISRDPKDRELGVQRQEADCRKRAKQLGWAVAGIYTDNNISAAGDRPDWERLLADIKGERVDAVLAYSSSRLYRDVDAEKGRLFQACLERDHDRVAIQTVVSGEINPYTADGRQLANILASVDQAERERTSERVKRTFADKRVKGEPLGSPSYGWRRQRDAKGDPIIGPFEKDPNQQAKLRSAARAFVGGASYAKAATILGVAASNVARTILLRPESQRALGELGDRVAIETRRRRSGVDPGTRNQTLMAGIARCECGGRMQSGSTRGGRSQARRPYAQYRCAVCGAAISGTFLDQHVSAAVLDAIDLRALERRMKDRKRQPTTAEVLAIQARIEELEDAYGDGTLTKAAFIRQRDRQQAKLAVAQAAVAEQAPELPLDLARHLPERWPGMTTIGRRDVIRALVKDVVVARANGHGPVDPKRINILWR